MNKETKVVDAENTQVPVGAGSDQNLDKKPAAASVPALDPAILAAINAAVVGSVKAIVEQLKPAMAAPVPTHAAAPAQYPTPYVPPYEPYNTKLKGIPVEPGQDLRHVHPAIINRWFATVEQRAKDRIQAQGAKSGLQSAMTIGRGY